ncbi:MAG: hypothetical protein JWR80_8141 [Bradyrhizobium sp.]|nr:hypothetical protein [Bradyrhizobium sp.]
MAEAIFPIVNALNAPFWEAAAEGQLQLPFCLVSDRFFWPPNHFSPFSGTDAIAWRKAGSGATLLSRVVFRRCFQAPFAPLMPYAVGLLQLDAGPRILAYLADPDAPGSAQAGARMHIEFAQLLPEGPAVPTAVIR